MRVKQALMLGALIPAIACSDAEIDNLDQVEQQNGGAIALGTGFCRLGTGAAAGPIGLGAAVCWIGADVVCVAATGKTLEEHACIAVAELYERAKNGLLPECAGGDGASLEPIFRPRPGNIGPDCQPKPDPRPQPIVDPPPPPFPPEDPPDDDDDEDCDESYCSCMSMLGFETEDMGPIATEEQCQEEYRLCTKEDFPGFYPYCPGNDRLVPPATAWGDPHMVTFDQLAYDFQGVGEFWLFRSAQAQVDFAARFVPWGSHVSGADAAAMRVVGTDGVPHSLSFFPGAPHPVVVDGQPMQPNAIFSEYSVGYMMLPGGYEAEYDGWSFEIYGPAGRFRVSKYSISAEPRERFTDVRGLLGPAGDGDASNDLRGPDGASISLGEGQDLNQALGVWRVAESESPFHYFAGESWATFQDFYFPSSAPPVFSAPERDMAADACAPVADELLSMQCQYDVLVAADPQAALEGAMSALAPAAVVVQTSEGISIESPEVAAALIDLGLGGNTYGGAF